VHVSDVDVPLELLDGPAQLESIEMVTLADIRGELHAHTDWSDGDTTIIEMARASAALGYSFHVVTDHSAPYSLVNGLDGSRLEEQRRAIAEAQAQLGSTMTVLCGTELEINPDASLGLPDDVLAQLDWVVASLHRPPADDPDVVKRRYLAALDNPLIECIAHPTGRLIGRRERYAVDVEWLVEHAARTGTMLELNANPRRLDLDAEHLHMARNAGVKIAIGSDAHGWQGLSDMVHGVAVARHAGLSAADVVNTRDVEALQALRPRNRA
jgi:DNA polymerase (family 10)